MSRGLVDFDRPRLRTSRALPLLKEIERLRLKYLDEASRRLEAAKEAGDRKQIEQQQQIKRRYQVGTINDCLRDTAFPSVFHHLRNGGLQDVPSSEAVLQIARCCHFSDDETNLLLKAAGYPLIHLHKALNQEHVELLDYLPLPAFVIDVTWQVLRANRLFWQLWHVPPQAWNWVTDDKRNMLYLLFDPLLPFRDRLVASPEEWERMAVVNVRAFKAQLMLGLVPPESEYSEKISKLIDLCRTLPDFERLWDSVEPTVSDAVLIATFKTQGHLVENPPFVRLMHVRMSLGDVPYPMTMAYVPADEEARAWFTAIGLPTPENGWGTNMLQL